MLLTIERHEIIRRFTGISLVVRLDGEPVPNVFVADDEQGYVGYYPEPRRINGQCTGIVAEIKFGKVTFTRKAEES